MNQINIEYISRARQSTQEMLDKHYKTNYPMLTIPTASFSVGKKYARMSVGNTSQRSVLFFINMETGNVLKPSSWKAPAKYSEGRLGTVLDDSYKKYITPYGPVSLKR